MAHSCTHPFYLCPLSSSLAGSHFIRGISTPSLRTALPLVPRMYPQWSKPTTVVPPPCRDGVRHGPVSLAKQTEENPTGDSWEWFLQRFTKQKQTVKGYTLIHWPMSCLPMVPGMAGHFDHHEETCLEDAQQRGLTHSTASTMQPQGICTHSSLCQEHFPQISPRSFLYFIQVSVQRPAP